jgi:ubiquinone/menaquinone biosynthesis C-methylase UbiE
MFSSLGEQLQKPSGFYGKLVALMMNRRNKLAYKRVIEELQIKSGDALFEIGYGPGQGISLIADAFSACTINGIDYSELMFQEAVKRNRKHIESGRVHLLFGDFLSHDFHDEKHDKVFCLNVIYFWPDLQPPFSKVLAMLHEGGMFCLFMTPKTKLEAIPFTGNFNKYAIETVEAELKLAGFQSVKYHLGKGGYYIMAVK